MTAVIHLAAALRALGCEYKITDPAGNEYASAKTRSQFEWPEDIFAEMTTTDVGEQLTFTIDPTWDFRKVQSFRATVKNHATKNWGEGCFVCNYNRETGDVTALRTESRK